MEELFSVARPLSPFYGDVKLISDSPWKEARVGKERERGKRRAPSIIRSADAMSNRLKSIGCFFSLARARAKGDTELLGAHKTRQLLPPTEKRKAIPVASHSPASLAITIL